VHILESTIPKHQEEYFLKLEHEFGEIGSIAKQARLKGLDPAFQPESIVTLDLAERVEKSVGPSEVATRIRELTKLMPREELAFKVAEEIVYGRFGVSGEAAAEQAIRTALSILDEGVTVAPIQGISSVRIKTNPDKTKYLAVYFAGPIRSAGGTEMALILIVADFVRRLLGLDRYKGTEMEARRFVEELRLYEREVARFQYKLSDKELFNAILNLPVEVNGVETDPIEVASFRNLPRIETNRVRGGALRVVNDGLIGRTQKVLKIVEKLGIGGWGWLREIRPPTTENEEVREFMYMEDVVAGRPIFSFPASPGGFRLRYGRSRNTGLAALGVHPATMSILGNFMATGTQLRVEKPGKAGVVLPVESIEPPVVRLKDGTVLQVEDLKTAERVVESVEAILFLGDLLVAFGEFLENNRALVPSGFVEEWWGELLSSAVKTCNVPISQVALKTGINELRLTSMLSNALEARPTPIEALTLCDVLGVPLHPKYTYFWGNISIDEFKHLRQHFSSAAFQFEDAHPVRAEVKSEPELKAILEKLCVPHVLAGKNIRIEDEAAVIHRCLGLHREVSDGECDANSAVELVSKLSGVKIHDKAPAFVGARMGRPEKAKRREMRPVVHCLFPVGLSGGARRNIVEAAATKQMITVELVRRRCPSCKELTHLISCPKCHVETLIERVCPNCGRSLAQDLCPACKIPLASYERRTIDLKGLFDSACMRLGMENPSEVVKGVRGLTSGDRVPEPIEKGILRAKYDLSVFKDGTVRFDATNCPLTHFKPREVGVPIERIGNLGYDYDMNGEDLVNDDQLCPLKVEDVIIPDKCADYFVRVAGFLDEILERLYGLPAYYKVRSKDDLVGHMIIGLSPHTSVGVAGRVIGFTKANACFAHPFWHAAKRRDCDGDEDALILALDVLLNFSRSFLPAKIGGLMDAPLLLTLVINPFEVARQATNIEVVDGFPTVFFEEAARGTDPRVAMDFIETVSHRLGKEDQFESWGFTHRVGDINVGNHESIYKKLGSMLEKVREQLGLAERIKAVKAGEVARKVLSTHFMRDVTGNLKAFSSQKLRCIKCNSKFRRIPLRGVCPKCGGKISLTVYRGTIEKYLEVAKELVLKYGTGRTDLEASKVSYADFKDDDLWYYWQRLLLIEKEIDSLFQERRREHEQRGLSDYM